uniref:replication factor C subunit 1-like n=1 Tax=Ciona intestinalis TaxID=7719 RepID=UPI0002B8DACA|nr:replication factor C subunit 1-like [Ciona intestinalis]|eukprot:XP_002119665.2 replication factor C subunit 1-like [Ciona intestinalis]
MDIRSFFGSGSKSKSSVSSEEEKSKKKPKKKIKKGVLFDSDSSDENPLPTKVRKQLNSSDIIPDSEDESSKTKKVRRKKRTIKEVNVNLKETTPSSFFGNFKPTPEKSRIQKRKNSDGKAESKNKLPKKEPVDAFDDLEDVLPKEVNEQIKGGSTVASKLAKAASARMNDVDIKTESKLRKSQPKKTSSDKSKQIKEEPSESKTVKTKVDKIVKETEEVKSRKTSETKLTPKKVTPEKKTALTETEQSSAKKERFMKYKQWQNRGGPPNPGSKEIPKGEKNCMEGLSFVITGVQDSLSREEIKSLVERYGGKVVSAVSGRTSYLITGTDAGESKLNKAKQHKTKIIEEDEFLDLIRTLKGKKSKYDVYESPVKTKKSPKAETAIKKESITKLPSTQPKKSPKPPKIEMSSSQSSQTSANSQGSLSSLPASQKLVAGNNTHQLMWVDKYKPKTIKQIIGQQGASSNMNKLLQWLRNWHSNNRTATGKSKPKPKTNQWGGGDPTGVGFKAALLSGPPGVGKTTTATLACQELGFSFIELNASDQRSKRTLQEDVSTSLQNTSISEIFGSKSGKCQTQTDHVMLMDEVDGMAGNEDRGGMQELIQLIKQTKIPIICMCNDRSTPKMRSLTNHCFDLRFQRPRVEQITGAVMSICHKERLKVDPPSVQAIIRGCNQDVRQVLHNLNMLKASVKSLTYDDAKKHADNTHKDVNLGIFEIARKLLSESSSLSIIDKSSLFFMDYSMIPKFIQDNYLHIHPFAAKGDTKKHLHLLSKAADCLATSDLIESTMRSSQSWSLLPTLGMMSTVLPTTIMNGSMHGMINFPSFFGKLSTTGKNHRLLQELKFHSSLVTGGAQEETLNLDVLTYLRWHLYRPLQEQSQTGSNEVHRITKLLDDYDLTREDFDSIMEIGQFQGKPNPLSSVDSKVKAAFTRLYNKESHMIPYAVTSATAAKKKRKVVAEDELDEEGNSLLINESEEEEDMGADGMIKQSKKKAAPKPRAKKATSSAAASTKKSKPRKK